MGQNGRTGEEGESQGGLRNVVDFARTNGAPDHSDSDIKDQIRDMQNNFLARISYGREHQLQPASSRASDTSDSAPSTPTHRRHEATHDGVGRHRRRASIVSMAMGGAQSMVSKGKKRGTVALLSFHICLTAVWAILGACFYCWRLGWTFSGALYFIFQAGYGVGFSGALVLNQGKHAHGGHISLDVIYFTTIFVCLIGSLSVFSLYAFFFHEFQLHAFQSHLDKESREGGGPRKRKRVGAYVSRSFHWFCGGWLNDLLGIQLPAVAYAALAFGLVVVFGIGIGIGYEGLTFHEAVYFTISAVQTSGLSAPKENPSSELLCTLLVIIGVPTYAALCSLLLERIVRPYTTRLQKKMMRHRLASHDNLFLSSIRNNRMKINSDNRMDVITAAREVKNYQSLRNPQDTLLFNNSQLLPTSPARNHHQQGGGEGGRARRERRGTVEVKANAMTKDGLNWTEYLEVELMRMNILEMDTLQAVWENFCVQSLETA